MEKVKSQIELVADELNRDKKIVQQLQSPGIKEGIDAKKYIQSKSYVYPWVSEDVIADVVEDWTGIPARKMLSDDIENLLSLEDSLENRIYGQTDVIKALSRNIRISKSGIRPNDKPLGVFMLAGPTGTGKTETAATLAEYLYAGEQNLISFNMTEYQESHTASSLKGAPPGYVGYGKGGVLTEAIRKRPYSVLLLDEFDKAHEDIYDLFYQVFDRGSMKDGEGRAIDFRNCLILLTTNVGSYEIAEAVNQDPEIAFEELQKVASNALLKVFSPALMARIQVLPYRLLDKNALCSISKKHIAKIQKHIQVEKGIELIVGPEVFIWMAEKVLNHNNSGRAIDELISNQFLPKLSECILRNEHQNVKLRIIKMNINNDEVLISCDGKNETNGVRNALA